MQRSVWTLLGFFHAATHTAPSLQPILLYTSQHKQAAYGSKTYSGFTSMRTSVDDTQLAVCGLHMKGQKLEHQLTDLGATFNRNCRSSPIYELYAITDSANNTFKPGMIAVGRANGKAIELDIWNVPVQSLGQFLMQVPAPLGLGTLFLDDGSAVKGFICEGYVASLSSQTTHDIDMPGQSSLKVENITHFLSWKQYLNQRI